MILLENMDIISKLKVDGLEQVYKVVEMGQKDCKRMDIIR